MSGSGFEYDHEFEYDEEIGEALDYLDLKDGVFDGAFTLNTRRPNAHGGFHSCPNSSLQPPSNRAQKVTSRIRTSPLEDWEGRFNIGMSNSVTAEIRESVCSMAIGRTKVRDKADRATVEKAIDTITSHAISKMLNHGIFDYIYGCISTGKEANVYHATKSDGPELAVKVYKTSVLVFKDRSRYLLGNRRFDYGFNKHNPRQMVKIWAEKEMRNLMRLKAAGVRCPSPLHLRLHVLVMEFIGKWGWAAPRLKDANLSRDRLRESYLEIILAMRTMYQKCKLVHGDLSEYNILYYEGQLYIIDVSQSVDLDHPLALDFLREDIVHVSDFFKKNGVAVMAVRELFDFIVDAAIHDDSVDSYLEEVQQKNLARGNVMSAEEEIADAVFTQAYIPKRLNQVKNVEEDVLRITSGSCTDTKDIYYDTIIGLKQELPMPEGKQQNKQLKTPGKQLPPDSSTCGLGNVTEEKHNCSLSGTEDDEFSSEVELSTTASQRREIRKVARKENKRRVKEEKREARKAKPQALKKENKKAVKAKKVGNSSCTGSSCRKDVSPP
ncbi:hypothetical protein OROMI_004938 [Orobanche minor]